MSLDRSHLKIADAVGVVDVFLATVTPVVAAGISQCVRIAFSWLVGQHVAITCLF